MKQTKNFSFITPLITGVAKPTNHGDLLIDGIGYRQHGEITFDLNTVALNGKDCTDLYSYLAAEEMSNIVEIVNEATMQHVTALFMGEYAYPELTAKERVEAGEISFETIGNMVRDMNKVLYPDKTAA